MAHSLEEYSYSNVLNFYLICGVCKAIVYVCAFFLEEPRPTEVGLLHIYCSMVPFLVFLYSSSRVCLHVVLYFRFFFWGWGVGVGWIGCDHHVDL